MLKFSSDDLRLCIYQSALNWYDWRDCYEHAGSIRRLPVLASKPRFKKFILDYDLRWLGSVNVKDRFRERIRVSVKFQRAIRDGDAELADEVIDDIRTYKKTKKGYKWTRQLSAISKIATFANPNAFTPIDKYVRKGLTSLGATSKSLSSYTGCLAAIHQYVPNKFRMRIRQKIRKLLRDSRLVGNRAFENRVLDHVLMRLGGRW